MHGQALSQWLLWRCVRRTARLSQCCHSGAIAYLCSPQCHEYLIRQQPEVIPPCLKP